VQANGEGHSWNQVRDASSTLHAACQAAQHGVVLAGLAVNCWPSQVALGGTTDCNLPIAVQLSIHCPLVETVQVGYGPQSCCDSSQLPMTDPCTPASAPAAPQPFSCAMPPPPSPQPQSLHPAHLPLLV
jgi:hypothetical protein